MTTHYAGIGHWTTACGLPMPREASEAEPVVGITLAIEFSYWEHAEWFRPTGAICCATSNDPREVDCPECVAAMPEVPACACGAPALYGARPLVAVKPVGRVGHAAEYLCSTGPLYCAACCPEDCRCLECRSPLHDATAACCEACMLDSADTLDDPEPWHQRIREATL